MGNSKLKRDFIERAKRVFKKNTIQGYSSWKKTNYKFIAPASTEYTYQWLWDTAFHAITLSNFDAKWAEEEIKNYLKGPGDDGFMPHTIFWGDKLILPHWVYIESKRSFRPRTSAITQPPAMGLAIEKVYLKHRDKKFLKEVLPDLARHHRWLLENRDPDQDFLISIISPNESGMDELPVFQVAAGYTGTDTVQTHYAFRKGDLLNNSYNFDSKKILQKDYFNVEELLFNTIFIESNRSLARLFLEIDEAYESQYFFEVALRSEKNLLTKCWDDQDEIFYSLSSKDEKKIKVKTVASLIPLFLDGLKGEKLDKLIAKHLLNPQEFWTNYPVPSVARSESYYVPTDTPFHKVKLLWRGPTWINTNWLIVQGLRKHGHDVIADKIVGRMVEMMQKWGFREYYNPETGEGYRREDFGWSTLIVDLL